MAETIIIFQEGAKIYIYMEIEEKSQKCIIWSESVLKSWYY